MGLSELAANNRPSEEAVKLLSDHPPLIFCGVTGAGKDTMLDHLGHTGRYATVISHTTRAPRENNGLNEVNGVDYWFIDEHEAEAMLNRGDFIEAEFNHHRLYGTSVQAFRSAAESGQQVLMEIDIKGVMALMQHNPDLQAIFLAPPDFDTWMRRLDGRGALSDEERKTRLTTAAREFEMFEDGHNFIPVINHEIIDTAAMIKDGSYALDTYTQLARRAIAQMQIETQRWLASIE